jgi:CheY-like chemotaxis protein
MSLSGDLLTLRLLVVAAQSSVHELWREGAALASVPIEFSEADAAQACAILPNSSGFDIVIIDAGPAAANPDAVIKAANAVKPLPLIAISAASGTGRIDGVSIFRKPANAQDANALVERCIRLRLPKRVLIVDDSRTMRSIVRKILSASRFAFEVDEAEEGIGALQKLADAYELVLLDYNMPGFNGIETLSEIKRVAPRTAVVMMTSTENEAIVGRAQASGALAFLKKPFYPADIEMVIERMCEIRPER